jgi:hypothetical protein
VSIPPLITSPESPDHVQEEVVGNRIDQSVLYTFPGFARVGEFTPMEKGDKVANISNHHPLYNF